MTSHMIELVRELVGDEEGPVLEIGSLVEVNQDHLNLRQALPRTVRYHGIDVVAGPGVDHVVDILDPEQLAGLMREISPRVTLCLYVVEHVWEIHAMVAALAVIWRANPESWVVVATHQNQPFHGTARYGDFWRLTPPGLARLVDTCGLPGAAVFSLGGSNPEDVVAVREPATTSRGLRVPLGWERYR